MMNSLSDRRWLVHTVKNLLRFSKGKGFREIIYGAKHEQTYSEFFLSRIRDQMLIIENEDSAQFMNNLFNSVNDITSETLMIFKEANKQNVSPVLLKRSKFFFDLIMDLCRILEMLATHVPEIFIARN